MSEREFTFGMTLRDKPVMVSGFPQGADRDVGIMSDYIEVSDVIDDETGVAICDLTGAEELLIQEKFCEAHEQSLQADDIDWYMSERDL